MKNKFLNNPNLTVDMIEMDQLWSYKYSGDNGTQNYLRALTGLAQLKEHQPAD